MDSSPQKADTLLIMGHFPKILGEFSVIAENSVFFPFLISAVPPLPLPLREIPGTIMCGYSQN